MSPLTGIFGGFFESFDPLLSIGTRLRDGVDVVPLQLLGDVHHGLRLVRVGWKHPGKILEASFVAEVDAGGGVADLWDLKRGDGDEYCDL